MSISDSLSGGRLSALEALRDRLAQEIDGCDPSQGSTVLTALAALSNRFQDVLREIEALDPPVVQKPATALDELAARRDARRKTG